MKVGIEALVSMPIFLLHREEYTNQFDIFLQNNGLCYLGRTMCSESGVVEAIVDYGFHGTQVNNLRVK
jgi:hypothetical protein